MAKKIKTRNLVAAHAHKSNRSVAFKDKTKYNRKPKHKGGRHV